MIIRILNENIDIGEVTIAGKIDVEINNLLVKLDELDRGKNQTRPVVAKMKYIAEQVKRLAQLKKDNTNKK